MSGQRSTSSAFSLLELLVTLALVAILGALATGQFGASARRKDLRSCQFNLQKIYVAFSLYRNDNGAYPYLKDATASEGPLSLLVPKSTTTTEIFICPGSGDTPLPESERFANRRISYAYYMGFATNDNSQEIVVSDWQIDNAPKKAGQQIFSLDGKKPGNNHYSDGGNLLSLSGEISKSGPRASCDLLYPSSVTMLNP